jgi:uncharacterized membrane protein YgaE (UPF0421/DUF939 family)
MPPTDVDAAPEQSSVPGLERWRMSVRTRPRLGLALKAAIAAALAWLCVLPIDGAGDAYPYYAPFGAVVAVTSTFASSVRGAAQAVAAIAAAVLTAAVAELVPLPTVVSIAAVVGIGTLVGGYRRLGEMGSWVPTSALFVLIIGGSDPVQYVAGYLGLTTLGAVVGVLVNGAFPPLPLTASSLALRRLRAALADQLEELAGGLCWAAPPTGEEWFRRRRRLEPHVEEMRRLVQQASEARRGNWRARRWQETADRQYEHARTLERLSGLVEELVELVVERECADAPEVALGPDLRPVAAGSLEALALVLRARPEEPEWREAYELLEDRIEALRASTRRAWREGDQDRFTAAALVVDLERATESLRQTAESQAHESVA